MKSEKRQSTFEHYWAAFERRVFKRALMKRKIAKPNKVGPFSKERRSSARVKTKMPEAELKQWLDRFWWWRKQFHPGPFMEETYMRPGLVTPQQLATAIDRSLEEITGILECERDLTREIAESIERRFGWPAKILLDRQRDCDEDVIRWYQNLMADAAPYLLANHCSEFEKTYKMLKKDVARLKKLALALRSRAR